MRWLPPIAALAYAFVIARRLGSIADQLTWNADYDSVMTLAQTVGTAGKSGRAVIIQTGWFWLDLAALRLPYHRQIWELMPYAMALIALGLIAWTAWRLAGWFAAVLTVSIGLAASPVVLATQAAQSYHGTTWLGAAALAAYLCWLLSRVHLRSWTMIVSALTAVVVGLATATDPLLIPSGDAPLAASLLLLVLLRRTQFGRSQLAPAFGMLVGAGVVAGALLLGQRLAGYGASFPRGLTHLVTTGHFAGNVRQLVSGVFEVAGMPRNNPGVLGIVLGLLLIAALLLPVAWAIRAALRDMPPPVLAVVAYWSLSAVFVAAAFLFSDVPSDFLQNSSRYLVPMFYVAVGTLPLWAAASERRLAIVAIPATLFIATNAFAIDAAAAAGGFEPAFSPGLAEPIAFLESHGLKNGYAAYDEASPISYKTDFALHVAPVTDRFLSTEDQCGTPICPFAYDSISDWYGHDGGPTFILIDTALSRMNRPPPSDLDSSIATYDVGRFVIYVYGDDVATHMGVPPRFTRPLL